mgnify:CR=1 FL=1
MNESMRSKKKEFHDSQFNLNEKNEIGTKQKKVRKRNKKKNGLKPFLIIIITIS